MHEEVLSENLFCRLGCIRYVALDTFEYCFLFYFLKKGCWFFSVLVRCYHKIICTKITPTMLTHKKKVFKAFEHFYSINGDFFSFFS